MTGPARRAVRRSPRKKLWREAGTWRMSDVLHASRHRRTAKAMDPNRGIHFMFACSFFYLLFTCANPIRRRALISVSALFGARPPLHPMVLSLAAAASLHHKGRRRQGRKGVSKSGGHDTRNTRERGGEWGLGWMREDRICWVSLSSSARLPN